MPIKRNRMLNAMSISSSTAAKLFFACLFLLFFLVQTVMLLLHPAAFSIDRVLLLVCDLMMMTTFLYGSIKRYRADSAAAKKK